jgi:hypothetical protein
MGIPVTHYTPLTWFALPALLLVGCPLVSADQQQKNLNRLRGPGSGEDLDNDGYTTDDCNDLDATVYPHADEICDGIDNDCNGLIDDEDYDKLVGAPSFYWDDDEDGYGDPDKSVEACEAPSGSVDDKTDCDDTDRDQHPGADELCNDEDDDCDGDIDENAINTNAYFPDEDGDGWGSDSIETSACEAPEGWVDQDGDCDDGNPEIYPGAWESCDDGVDNNCDDLADDADPELNPSTTSAWYRDEDGDGYGREDDTVSTCLAPVGYIAAGDGGFDCDDTDGDVHPGADEVCGDLVDQDCSGIADPC